MLLKLGDGSLVPRLPPPTGKNACKIIFGGRREPGDEVRLIVEWYRSCSN